MSRSAVSKIAWMGKARTLALWFLALLVAASIGGLLGVKPARAAEFRVNSTADAGDALPGNGQCATEILPEGARGICTLRAAIEEANGNDVSDTITFSSGLSGTITLTLGKLTIANDNTAGPDLTIEGPEGSGLTVSANNNSGVFAIAASSEATIDRLTIRDGRTDFGAGAGIFNGAGGTLTLTNSTVSGNTSNFAGGGISNGGTMMITNSTVSGNRVTGYDHGGGIANYGTTLTLTNSTVSDNTSHLAGGGIYRGGGTLELTNSTVSGNNAGNYGGGIYLEGGTAKLANTIVAGNAALTNGPDAFGAFTSQGNNLIGNASGSSGWITSGTNQDLLDTNPLLGPLQNNTPGPTETRAIWPGSPAIDHAANDRCLLTDQRGVARKDGDGNGSVVCDIGAYERSDFSSPKVSSTTPASGATGVKRRANISATFSEKMTRSTLSETTFKLFKVKSDGSTTQITAVAFSSSVDGLKATLDPSNLLLANTKYKAVVSTQARDLAGNQLDQSPTKAGKQQKAWTFKTGG